MKKNDNTENKVENKRKNSHVKKELKPSYYDEFSCIADKCSFTCCKEWNIAVDNDTYKEWNNYTCDNKKLTEYTWKKEGVRAMKLVEEHKCPFLDEHDLCRLVINYSDDILSDTCTTFPRQIHEFDDRTEKSLVSCCPEVIDIIKKQDRIVINERNAHSGSVDVPEKKAGLKSIRDTLMNIIQNKNISINTELMIIYEVMLAVLDNKGITNKELCEFGSDEYLKTMAEDIERMEFDRFETFLEDNELFLDLIENYKKEGFYEKHLVTSSSQAEYFETVMADNECEEKMLSKHIEEFKKRLTEYEPLFRKYLAAEFFTNAILPNGNLENFVVMIQWISLQYVGIRHILFLKWVEKCGLYDNQTGTESTNKCKVQYQNIDYEDVRDSIVLISRMTGYDQEDIIEYLDNSFQTRIWEWGYQALVIGK